MRDRLDTWWTHWLGKSSCVRKKGKPRKLRKTDVELANSKAKGFDNVKAPPPVRREPTFLDKLVLKQPPPADVATAEQYDGASFIRQSTPVALPKATSRKAVVKPRSRGAGAKASIAKCIAKVKVRREQREAEAAAAGKADEPATAGEAAEAGEADEVQIVQWANARGLRMMLSVREVAVDLED